MSQLKIKFILALYKFSDVGYDGEMRIEEIAMTEMKELPRLLRFCLKTRYLVYGDGVLPSEAEYEDMTTDWEFDRLTPDEVLVAQSMELWLTEQFPSETAEKEWIETFFERLQALEALAKVTRVEPTAVQDLAEEMGMSKEFYTLWQDYI